MSKLQAHFQVVQCCWFVTTICNDGTCIENVAFGKLHSTSGTASYRKSYAQTIEELLEYMLMLSLQKTKHAHWLVPKQIADQLQTIHWYKSPTESVVKKQIDVSNPVEVEQ